MPTYGNQVMLPGRPPDNGVPEMIARVLRADYEMTRREKVPTLPPWSDDFIVVGPVGYDMDDQPFGQWAWRVEV